MALFKIFRGKEEGLNAVPCHEGYAYFTDDLGNLFIDIGNNPGDRVQVNAYYASALRKMDTDGTITEIDIDDLVLTSAVAAVKGGGTGRDTLTVNAVIVGNGTDQVKMIAIANGDVVIGDTDNGIKGANGIGAFYSLVSGAPQFGTLPISAGGTEATTAAGAREKLDVYSKKEVDDKVADTTTLAYYITLLADAWVTTENGFIATYVNPDLKCGKNGNIPPIITYTSNLEEYSEIESAECTVGTGIIFTTKKHPTKNIGLIVIDVK